MMTTTMMTMTMMMLIIIVMSTSNAITVVGVGDVPVIVEELVLVTPEVITIIVIAAVAMYVATRKLIVHGYFGALHTFSLSGHNNILITEIGL